MKNRYGLCIGILVCSIFMDHGGFSADQWTPVITNGKTDDGTSVDGKKTTMEERLQQIISVEYKDADIANVLRSLAWTYKLNLLTSSDIKGKVTINLQEITVEKALEAILQSNGLVYNKKDGVIYVGAGDPAVVDLQTDVIYLKYTTATQAQNMVKKVLSAKGDIKINETANSMIITDFSENIQKIRKLLTKVDIAPKQVLIEAKILDISSSDLRSMGVTWNTDYKPNKGGLFDRSTLTQEELKNTVNLASQTTSLPVGQLVINALTLKNLTLGATIDALVRDGKAHLLASPSIAVINGQEARIVIGERFPYKERTQTTSGTTETTKFVDIGTTLKVNPQINEDGYITLTLHPEVSSLLASLDAGPRITTREADTTVRIKQGETLVIGGLISQRNDFSKDSVPILGQVPFLGQLFRRSDVDKEQKELAVFITPQILYSKEEAAAMGHKAGAHPNDTLLDTTSSLITVENLLEKANHLNFGEDYESAHKPERFRKTQALNHYELIYQQFPDSLRAPEALYQAGMLYWNYFDNYKKAKENFQRLISDYPDSDYAEKARKAYKEIEKQLMETWKKAEKQVKH